MSIPTEIQNSLLGLAILNQEVLAEGIYSDDTSGVYYSKIFQKPSNHIWYQISWLDSQTTPINSGTNIDVRIRTGDLLPYKSNLVNTRYTLAEYNARISGTNPNIIDAELYRWQLDRTPLGMNPPSGNPNIYYGTQGLVTENPIVFEFGTADNSARLGATPTVVVKNQEVVVTGNAPYSLGYIPQTGCVYIKDYSEVTILNSGLSYPTGTSQYKVDYVSGTLTFNPYAAVSGIYTNVTYYHNNTRPDATWNNWSVPYLRNIGYIANNVNHDYLQLRINLKSLDKVDQVELYKITVSSLLTKGS